VAGSAEPDGGAVATNGRGEQADNRGGTEGGGEAGGEGESISAATDWGKAGWPAASTGCRRKRREYAAKASMHILISN